MIPSSQPHAEPQETNLLTLSDDDDDYHHEQQGDADVIQRSLIFHSAAQLSSLLDELARRRHGSVRVRLQNFYGLQFLDADFSRHALAYLPAWQQLFSLRTAMICNGPFGGGVCPHSKCLCIPQLMMTSAADLTPLLSDMEMDHSLQPLQRTANLAMEARSKGHHLNKWHAGLYAPLLLHLLYGLQKTQIDARIFAAAVVPRCSLCHDTWLCNHGELVQVSLTHPSNMRVVRASVQLQPQQGVALPPHLSASLPGIVDAPEQRGHQSIRIATRRKLAECGMTMASLAQILAVNVNELRIYLSAEDKGRISKLPR